MCFSFESSIKSWFIALIGSLFLLIISKNMSLALWISAFTLTFTQIQIIEAIIWKSLESNPGADVSNVAKYIPILLWFQPFVQSIFGYINTKNVFLLYLSFVYLAIIFFELNTEDIFSVKISKKGHLIWKRTKISENKEIFILGDNFIYPYLYLFGLFAPLFFISNNNYLTKISLIMYSALSFLYSLLYAPDEFNSMWCFTAVNYILVANIAEIMTNYI